MLRAANLAALSCLKYKPVIDPLLRARGIISFFYILPAKKESDRSLKGVLDEESCRKQIKN